MDGDGRPPDGDRVARYWDEHHDSIRDPGYWMAHPLCRQAINRRVGGDPDEWPFDWFRRVHGPVPFEHGVSWGCGVGAFERAAVKIGVARRVDAFDISKVSLEEARRVCDEEGIHGVEFGVGDFNHPRLARGRYDVVLFHSSLHHVRRLERLFRALSTALRPGAAVYADEFVGPSRTEWTYESLRRAHDFLDSLPMRAKLRGRIPVPVHGTDASEAVRSSEIPAFLKRHFEIVAWRPYGGQLAGLLFPWLRPEWLASEEGEREVLRMLSAEDEELARNPAATHHLVAYGTLKPDAVSAGLLARLSRRARVATASPASTIPAAERTIPRAKPGGR